METLLQHVARSLDQKKLALPCQTLVVAVSGGLDSMVLLQLMSQLAGRKHWKLVVAHYNHRLRGKQSDEDEMLVRARARALKLRCRTGGGEVRIHAKEQGVSTEMAARELRHCFLAEVAREVGAKTIVLGHHEDDQLELFFLRLFRGSGTQGLVGMGWKSPSPASRTISLIRPLLDVPKEQLLAYAQAKGIPWHEDASNASFEYQRNRIRQELLPLLQREYQPALREKLLQSIDVLGAESEVVGDLAETWLSSLDSNPPKGPPFDSLPVGTQRRIIHSQLWRSGVSPTFQLVERLRLFPGITVSGEASQTGEAAQIVDAPRHQWGIRRNPEGRVLLIKTDSKTATWNTASERVQVRTGKLQFCNLSLSMEVASSTKLLAKRVAADWLTEVFDADRIGACIELRFWRPGDHYRPIGMKGDKKLQDCFTDLKIPRELRHNLVVASLPGGEIIWVEGLRIADGFKVTSATRRCLFWRWKRA